MAAQEQEVIKPLVEGYQLLGDCQFVRLAKQLLKLRGNSYYEDGITVTYIGLCVNEQKICDLLKRVRNGFHTVHSKVVVMIGTNDLLKGTSIEDMRRDLSSLVQELKSKHVSKIMLLTIPPVPRLQQKKRHWDNLYAYNQFIKRMNDGTCIHVLDTGRLFITPHENKRGSSSSGLTKMLQQLSYNQTLSEMCNFHSKSIGEDDFEGEEKHDSNSSNPASYKNLRVSFTTTANKRKVYTLDASSGDEDNSPSDFKGNSHNNDAFGGVNNAWEADYVCRIDCFQEYFGSLPGKVDKIHLNRKGLLTLFYHLKDKIADVDGS